MVGAFGGLICELMSVSVGQLEGHLVRWVGAISCSVRRPVSGSAILWAVRSVEYLFGQSTSGCMRSLDRSVSRSFCLSVGGLIDQ